MLLNLPSTSVTRGLIFSVNWHGVAICVSDNNPAIHAPFGYFRLFVISRKGSDNGYRGTLCGSNGAGMPWIHRPFWRLP